MYLQETSLVTQMYKKALSNVSMKVLVYPITCDTQNSQKLKWYLQSLIITMYTFI